MDNGRRVHARIGMMGGAEMGGVGGAQAEGEGAARVFFGGDGFAIDGILQDAAYCVLLLMLVNAMP